MSVIMRRPVTSSRHTARSSRDRIAAISQDTGTSSASSTTVPPSSIEPSSIAPYVSLPIPPDHRDRAHVLVREAAEVVGEAVAGDVFALSCPGLALHLQVDLVDHAHPGRAD